MPSVKSFTLDLGVQVTQRRNANTYGCLQEVGIFAEFNPRLTVVIEVDDYDAELGTTGADFIEACRAGQRFAFELNVGSYIPGYSQGGRWQFRNYNAAATTAPNTVYQVNQGTTSGVFTAANATEILTHVTLDIPNLSLVQVSNSGGALPTGLSAATNYWTIRQSSTTSKLAATYADAVAGTNLLISSDGTGTHTITLPQATDAIEAASAFRASLVRAPQYSDVDGIRTYELEFLLGGDNNNFLQIIGL